MGWVYPQYKEFRLDLGTYGMGRKSGEESWFLAEITKMMTRYHPGYVPKAYPGLLVWWERISDMGGLVQPTYQVIQAMTFLHPLEVTYITIPKRSPAELPGIDVSLYLRAAISRPNPWVKK